MLAAIQVILTRAPESRAIFAEHGAYVREGDLIRQPDLAA